ncbi:MAG: 50S ribosomal protein L15 [Candidatus Levybacteria bacterium]|nr:50S ribosomal protein L15 [Candidatus Levybacteria bacterium]
MKLYNLVKITNKKKRRLGQGHGSGRVKTAGRGTKGQKARGKIPLYFEGGAVSLIKRLPFRRGKGKNKVFKKRPLIINVKTLNLLKNGNVVDLKTLIDNKLIDAGDAKKYGVKVLGEGQLSISLTLKLPASKGAIEKIKKAGGTIES